MGKITEPTRWILGDKFDTVYGHQGSIAKLWETRWKFVCQRSLYPFHDGAFIDFEPIFTTLIAESINDPNDPRWTETFTPVAAALVSTADSLRPNDPAQAITLYKRAGAVYRISRFPYIGDTPAKRAAYEAQKACFLAGAALWETPVREVVIPFAGRAGGDGETIPLYVRVPRGATRDAPVPTILLMPGLDGHRPDNTERLDAFLARGWASVTCDIPGTADCPAARRDPASPDRLWPAVLDWMQSQGVFDPRRIVAWGLSAGGYYAIRAAHLHADRLAGAVGHGAGTHHYLGRSWLERVDGHEYPFSVTEALVGKYGYRNVEELKECAQRDFSLVESGIVEKPSCRLLLVNGVEDGLMPIEDSMLLFEYGRAKEARFYSGLPHMGYPPANTSVFPWLEEVMASVV